MIFNYLLTFSVVYAILMVNTESVFILIKNRNGEIWLKLEKEKK